MMATTQDRVRAAEVAITNAYDADILAALTQLGYAGSKIDEGKVILNEVQELVNRQIVEYGEQYDATGNMKSAWQVADVAYLRALKIARIALRDDTSAAAALLLNGRRLRTLTGWLRQSRAFYKNLLGNPDWSAAMQVYGYTTEKLQAEQSLVDAVDAKNLQQLKEMGEAQNATEKRDARMEDLDSWMFDFRQIAVIALEGNPQWLEKLGIKA